MTIAINPPATRAMLRALSGEYKRWYNKGWRYSASPSASLDCDAAQTAPDAWHDGYLDYAAGREKWHLAFCRGCPQHPGRLMPSKLMKRKVRWAREYANRADAKLKVLHAAQRAAFRGDTGEDRRQLALACGVIEADRRFQVVSIKDGRNPGNQRQSTEAYKRLDRAFATYAAHTGRKPDGYGSYWRYHEAINTEIDALVERLDHPTEENA